MARQLNAFPERPNRRRELERYLDGSVWELVQGEDFQGKVESFVSTARERAKEQGAKLRTRKLDDSRVVIQLVRP